MLLSRSLEANETGAHAWRSTDTRACPPPIKISPCRNTRSVRRGVRSSVRKKSRRPAARAVPSWRCCWSFSDAGDTLVVTRVDRLARSIKDLQDIVYLLKERGVTLRATEQPINTQSATGKAFLDMLGVFAEFETNLRRERQQEGIAAAKARGVYRGRKPSIDPAEIHRLRTEEQLGATAIARRLGIGRASVYRALARRDGES